MNTPTYECYFYIILQNRRKWKNKIQISAPLRKTRRLKAAVGRGADRLQRIVQLHSHSRYMDVKTRILDGITYDISRTLIVWCPQKVVPNDYVATVLFQYGEIEMFNETFSSCAQPDSPQGTWLGTIVEYSTKEDARTAFKQIPFQCRYF